MHWLMYYDLCITFNEVSPAYALFWGANFYVLCHRLINIPVQKKNKQKNLWNFFFLSEVLYYWRIQLVSLCSEQRCPRNSVIYYSYCVGISVHFLKGWFVVKILVWGAEWFIKHPISNWYTKPLNILFLCSLNITNTNTKNKGRLIKFYTEGWNGAIPSTKRLRIF